MDKNEEQAVLWFSKAAEQDLPGAQMMLADCYEAGLGVEKDEGKAQFWRDKSES